MSRSDAGQPWETVALAAFGTAVAAAALLTVIAGVAGLLFGDGWASGEFADVPGVIGRLPDQLGDPGGAWPQATADRLPGALGFYASALLVIVALGALTLGALRLHARFKTETGARWARSGELRPLKVRSPQPGRITLGRHGRSLIAAEPGQSVLAIAPTQSGKTTALAIPNILEWAGPVIALSVKTDLLRDTLASRKALGRVAVFDPTDATGLPSTASWTPLMGCRTWAGARRTARNIADGASSRRSLSDGDFWFGAAAKLLAPMLFAAAHGGLTMDTLIAWVDTQEESEVLALLEDADDEDALNALRANWSREERQRSSIYTTLETILEAYSDRGVLDHSRAPDIRADWLLDGGAHTLYLCAAARDQHLLRPVFVALLEEMIEAAFAKASLDGCPLDPPLLVVLDEVANVAPMPSLDVLASTAAGHGVQLLTLLQDLSQAYDRWGRERAETLVNNHRARVLGAGLADGPALDWARRVLGDTAHPNLSRTTGEQGRRSVTENKHFRPLAPSDVVREHDAREMLLVYGTLRAAWIRLRPWYAG